MTWFRLLGCRELRRVAQELALEGLVRVSAELKLELGWLLVFPMGMKWVDVLDPCLYYGKVGTPRWSLWTKRATVRAGEMCA